MTVVPRTPEGMVLFEVYVASGALLVVTSDGAAARDAMEPGDRIYRRPWASASEPVPLASASSPAVPEEACEEFGSHPRGGHEAARRAAERS